MGPLISLLLTVEGAKSDSFGAQFNPDETLECEHLDNPMHPKDISLTRQEEGQGAKRFHQAHGCNFTVA